MLDSIECRVEGGTKDQSVGSGEDILIQPSYSKEKTKERPREGKELKSGKRNMKERVYSLERR
jgi:hypothetical protein